MAKAVPAKVPTKTKGRPKGSKNTSTKFNEIMSEGFRDKMLKDGMEVVDVVIAKAKDGDMQAVKILFDRILPVTKAVDINATDIGKTGGITIHIEKLIAETGNPDEVLIEDGEIIED